MGGSISPNSNNTSLLPRLQAQLKAELRWVLDLLLPAHCPLCKTPLTPAAASTPCTQLLCPSCSASLHQRTQFCCPRCDEPYISTSTANHLCSRCLKDPPPFEWLKAATIFNTSAAHAIHMFKYQGKTTLSAALAQCIFQQLHQDIFAFQPQLLMPVPLHRSRIRQRGYNQSLLLTRKLAQLLQLPVDYHTLKRTQATSSQTLLSATQRHKNLRNAFSTVAPLVPQRILLVDDVATTTATARACATALCAQGHRVAVIALARATLT